MEQIIMIFILFAIVILLIFLFVCSFIVGNRYKKINKLNSLDFLRWLDENDDYSLETYEYRNVWDTKCIGKIVKNDFGLIIDLTANEGWAIKVYIDDILIYNSERNGMFWRHDTPKKMKEYVYSEIKTLNNLLKYYKNKDTIDAQEKYEKEVEYLIDKFK